LFEAQAGEAAMVGVHDSARLAEGGAEDAHGVAATERLHDGYTILYIPIVVNISYYIVWLQMKCETGVKPFRGQRLHRFSKDKMRLNCGIVPLESRRRSPVRAGK
jgi:hypothetical protein